MPAPKISLLSAQEIQSIHDASLYILGRVGVAVRNVAMCRRLAQAGISVQGSRAIFSEEQVMQAIAVAGKSFTLYGRDPQRTARFGQGAQNVISSPGQFAWFDHHTRQRRPPCLDDARLAGRLGDALDAITIVGGMAVPQEVPEPVRDVALTAELLQVTGKPVRAFPVSRRSSHYVLELLQAVAGGREALRQRP